jgi:hypothetical protein
MSQKQLDDLDGMGAITGSLELEGSDIEHLRALSTLRWVGGSLTLRNIRNLGSLEGLEQMAIVAGNLTLEGNRALETLTGLDSLRTIVGSTTTRA